MENGKYQAYLKSEHWSLLRGAKLQISPKCEVCGSREEIEVHHKIYRDRWFNTKLQDLKTLCHYHHVCEHVDGAKEAEKMSLKKQAKEKQLRDWTYRPIPSQFKKRETHVITMEIRNRLRAKKGKPPSSPA